ncbi:response regulator [Acidobacteria bacterium AB60]|nr:response regulator [Acidobacteria bacterium AB60]
MSPTAGDMGHPRVCGNGDGSGRFVLRLVSNSGRHGAPGLLPGTGEKHGGFLGWLEGSDGGRKMDRAKLARGVVPAGGGVILWCMRDGLGVSQAAATRVLVVDDDTAVLRSVEAVLVQSGLEVSAVETVAEALDLIGKKQFDVLLADLNIGEPGDGFTMVGAMRRVQPKASTFILTGYPDIESAILAIRNQVDDYFVKPLRVDQLLMAIEGTRARGSRRVQAPRIRSVAEVLRECATDICERWFQEVIRSEEVSALPLSKEERIDHVPELLPELANQLQEHAKELSAEAVRLSQKHGRTRYHQGYTIPQVLFETRILEKVICDIIEENLLTLNLSRLVPDVLEIGQAMQAHVEISIRAYQAQIPSSLQTSFSMLYKSPYLGVVIADEHRVIDANDAFLRMVGYNRDELVRGEIDWLAMTPERYRSQDFAAVEQLREFGACVPFEKEFMLPDGRMLPFLIGAVRLSIEPLQWSAYVVNLTEQRKLQAAERKVREWETKYAVINRLAHEVNNPLAALVFTTHLLQTHPDLTEDMRTLVDDSVGMLLRIEETVRRVLAESQDGPS